MPTKIIIMLYNFNIQTWKKCLVSFKLDTWYTEQKHTKQTTTKNKKIEFKQNQLRVIGFSM